MNVVLYGATGASGSRILQELISRGHHVTAVARDISRLPSSVTTRQDDLSDVEAIASVIQGADAVISAYAPPQDDTDAVLGVTERLQPSRRPATYASSSLVEQLRWKWLLV